MRCVAHISDLHFGTEDGAVTAGFLRDLLQQEPSLVIISGDLTQRARRRQFSRARKFLQRIPIPMVVVPGNHDVPLFDLLRRFLSPLARYKKWISSELDSRYEDQELIVVGINTARSLTWKSGRISLEQIEYIRASFCRPGSRKFKILVTHHPFIPPPGDITAGIDLVGRAAMALPVIDQCGVDLLLSGHLHHGYSGDMRTYYPSASRSIIVVQAGTAISRRIRTEPNAYNILRLDKTTISIQVRSWNGADFAAEKQALYKLHQTEWRLNDAVDVFQQGTPPHPS